MIFKNGYRITQQFGNNPKYYSQFGFKGHEGLDIIPTDSNWNIYAPEDGIIVRDVDHARDFDAYGNLIVLWNKKNKRAWWFAHNTENYVSLGQVVVKGKLIAKMGSTGNSVGAHVHLGLRLSDEGGSAININNGYKGFVNPLPILNSLGSNSSTEPSMNENIIRKSSAFDKIVHELYMLKLVDKDNSDIYTFEQIWGIVLEQYTERNRLKVKAIKWDQLCTYLGLKNSDIVTIDEVKFLINGLYREDRSGEVEQLEKEKNEWQLRENAYINEVEKLKLENTSDAISRASMSELLGAAMKKIPLIGY